MSGQAVAFLTTAAAGAALGVLYDCFRILRRVVRHKTAATTAEDAIFWIASTLLMFALLMSLGLSEIRGFIFMGLALGAILYFMMLSNFFMRFALAVSRKVKRALYAIITPIAAIFVAAKKRLKSGRRYVKMKGRKVYQHMKRRRHEGQGSEN
jgi:spore cortex biosynthesis protein YabQ